MSNVSHGAFMWDLWISMAKLAFGRLLPSLHVPLNDLSGKTAIITGANSGIGQQIALDLAKQGARVYLACRNNEKASQAADEIISACPAAKDRCHTLELDTSSLSSVRSCAQTFTSLSTPLDILIHNAGRSDSPPSTYSPDSHPLIYSTNFLGSFLLTHLLEPHLSPTARIILTTSTGQYGGAFSPSFSLTDPLNNTLEPGFHYPTTKGGLKGGSSSVPPSLEYANSKLMQSCFAKLLTQRWSALSAQTGQPSHLTAHSFTPGFTSTPIFTKSAPGNFFSDPLFWVLKLTYNFAATPVQQGALTGVWLASTSDAEVVGQGNGGGYWDRMTRRVSKMDLLSQEMLDRLWVRWEADAGVEWRCEW